MARRFASTQFTRVRQTCSRYGGCSCRRWFDPKQGAERQLFLKPLWCPPSGWQHGMGLHVPRHQPGAQPWTPEQPHMHRHRHASASPQHTAGCQQPSRESPCRVTCHSVSQQLASCPRYRELAWRRHGWDPGPDHYIQLEIRDEVVATMRMGFVSFADWLEIEGKMLSWLSNWENCGDQSLMLFVSLLIERLLGACSASSSSRAAITGICLLCNNCSSCLGRSQQQAGS